MGRGLERLAPTFAERGAKRCPAGGHDDHLRTLVAFLEDLATGIIRRDLRRGTDGYRRGGRYGGRAWRGCRRGKRGRQRSGERRFWLGRRFERSGRPGRRIA